MLLDLQNIAKALGGEVRNGQVLCPGPGHSPVDRSLAVKLDPSAPDGFLVNSFSTDDAIKCKDYVRQKLGLPAFKPNGSKGRPRRSEAELEAALLATINQQQEAPPKNIVQRYCYADEKGEPLYEVVRLEPKDFRQRRLDSNGKWQWGLGDVRRVLYRLPELLKFPDATILVTEGEKDADRVASLGHCATTVASGKWTAECVEPLRGRDVIILRDMDEPGRKKALIAAHAVHGVAATVRIVELPGLTGHPNNKDVSDWLAADPRRAEKLVDVCFAAPLWEPPPCSSSPPSASPSSSVSPSLPSSLSSQLPQTGEAETPTKTPVEIMPLPFTSVSAWHGKPVPEREWTVLNRVPARNVTLMSGDGGVGKTILALHLCAAVALARDWLGSMPECGSAMAFCCEDDPEELHRRMSLIADHFGISLADLKDMHVRSMAGDEALLAAPDKSGIIKPTELFIRLQKTACEIRPKLIVLDNSADIFGGNENDRAQVRQFITILRGLALTAGAGVLLTSHPSLTGINSGSGLSGSTGWNNNVRSRMYFRKVTTEKGDEPDPDLRVLEIMKANYGPVGETVNVRWSNGLFLPVASMGTFDKAAAEQKAEELFLRLLDRFNGQGRNVSHKKAAHNYAPTAFATDPDGKGKRKDLTDAMTRLFNADKIKVETYGRGAWQRIERK